MRNGGTASYILEIIIMACLIVAFYDTLGRVTYVHPAGLIKT